MIRQTCDMCGSRRMDTGGPGGRCMDCGRSGFRDIGTPTGTAAPPSVSQIDPTQYALEQRIVALEETLYGFITQYRSHWHRNLGLETRSFPCEPDIPQGYHQGGELDAEMDGYARYQRGEPIEGPGPEVEPCTDAGVGCGLSGCPSCGLERG